jgi:group I intron endonuclease
MYHIIYLTRNLINHKIYIGKHSTWNLNDGYLGSGTAMLNAIKKYGRENFERTILHYCYDEEQMYEYEEYIVDKLFIERKDTYNLVTGGVGGRLASKETKKKISKSLIGNQYHKDILNSEETRKKMSEASKGKPKSEEHKIKIRESLQGKTHSEERKRKNSEGQLGQKRKPHSEETKRKMSEARKGNHYPR